MLGLQGREGNGVALWTMPFEKNEKLFKLA